MEIEDKCNKTHGTHNTAAAWLYCCFALLG